MLKVKVRYTGQTTSKMTGPESHAQVKVRYTGPTTFKMIGPVSDAQGEGKGHWTNYSQTCI